MMAVGITMTTTARQHEIVSVAKSTGVSINLPKMVNKGVLQSAAERNAALSAFYSAKQQHASNVSKVSRRADELGEEDIIPTYAMDNYIFSEVAGVLTMPMYEGASYAVKDDKIYLSPFDGLNFIEGEFAKEKGSLIATDSVTFTISTEKEAGEDRSGKKYYYGLGTLVAQERKMVRNNKMTIGAYYFPENGELYIPAISVDDFICLFAEDSTEPEFSYNIANLDIIPQADFTDYIHPGKYKAFDAFEPSEKYSGKIKAFINGTSIFIKGLNSEIPATEDTWTEFKTDDEYTSALVSDEQLLGFGEYYTDETRKNTAQVVFTPVGALSDLSNVTSDLTSSYFIEINEDRLIISSTGMDIYGLYALSTNKDFSTGVVWMTDLQISIRLAPGEDPEDIEVTTSSKGYATFFDSQSAYILPEGLTAQTVTGITNGKLTYKTLTDGIVPKNTAVILSGEAESNVYTLTPTDEDVTYTGSNLLYGSDEPTMTTADYNCCFYKLTYAAKGSNFEGLFAWFWGAANGGAFQIEGHKAWLAVPTAASARYFINNDTDGIMAVEKADKSDNAVFDLQGRRVNTIQKKGLYIKSGKKIINM